MQYQRGVCIFNPVAGVGAGQASVHAVRDRLLREVGELRLWPTESPNHAAELARRASADGYDLLVIQGGDGTVNEAVQGLAGRESPALLVLPGGTANVLVNEIGLAKDPLAVVASLPTLVARAVPLGLVEFDDGTSRFFLVMCGAGLDAEIANATTTRLKHRLGLGAFWLRGTKRILGQFPRLRIAPAVNEKPTNGASSLVVVSKSRTYGGGLVLTPDANLFSDRLAVADFTSTSRIQYCGYLLAAICSQTSWWPGIRHSACAEVRIEPDEDSPVQVQVDGEVAGRLPARVSLASQILTLLLPPEYGSEYLGGSVLAA